MKSEQLQQIIIAIDSYNQQDPKQEALLYGQQMSLTQHKLYPKASIELQIAARGQHVGRWEIARNTYPTGKVGYHTWRKALYKHHATILANILLANQADDDSIQVVQQIVQKKDIKTNTQSQQLEDIACYVFLAHYYTDFITPHDDDKVIGILRKTWRKMSVYAQQKALKIPINGRAETLLKKALN